MDPFSNFNKSLNINAPAFIPTGFNPSPATAADTESPESSTAVKPSESQSSEQVSNVESKLPHKDEEIVDDWEAKAEADENEEEELDDAEEEDLEDGTGEEEAEETKEVAKSKKRGKKVSECSDGKPKKEHNNIVFIGHVDAGKSTIGGQLLYLTGQVDKRTLEKYEREAKEKNRESWYLSWALDTNQEERDKGKTVEVGRAFFETENKHFTLLDAPGNFALFFNIKITVKSCR